jgi:hypothetical protein
MIRRLLITSACVGIAVIAPAAVASASTAKSANCCGGGIVQGAPTFVPTSTVTYGNTVIPTTVVSGGAGVMAASNCMPPAVYAASDCMPPAVYAAPVCSGVYSAGVCGAGVYGGGVYGGGIYGGGIYGGGIYGGGFGHGFHGGFGRPHGFGGNSFINRSNVSAGSGFGHGVASNSGLIGVNALNNVGLGILSSANG